MTSTNTGRPPLQLPQGHLKPVANLQGAQLVPSQQCPEAFSSGVGSEGEP